MVISLFGQKVLKCYWSLHHIDSRCASSYQFSIIILIFFSLFSSIFAHIKITPPPPFLSLKILEFHLKFCSSSSNQTPSPELFLVSFWEQVPIYDGYPTPTFCLCKQSGSSQIANMLSLNILCVFCVEIIDFINGSTIIL